MDRDNTLSAEAKYQVMTQDLNGRWFSEALDTELRRRATRQGRPADGGNRGHIIGDDEWMKKHVTEMADAAGLSRN